MGAGRPMNPLTKTNPIHKLPEPIHLWVYSTQPITTRVVLVRVLGLSFTTRESVDPTH